MLQEPGTDICMYDDCISCMSYCCTLIQPFHSIESNQLIIVLLLCYSVLVFCVTADVSQSVSIDDDFQQNRGVLLFVSFFGTKAQSSKSQNHTLNFKIQKMMMKKLLQSVPVACIGL